MKTVLKTTITIMAVTIIHEATADIYRLYMKKVTGNAYVQ